MAKEGPFTDVPDSDDGGDEGETEGGAADMQDIDDTLPEVGSGTGADENMDKESGSDGTRDFDPTTASAEGGEGDEGNGRSCGTGCKAGAAVGTIGGLSALALFAGGRLKKRGEDGEEEGAAADDDAAKAEEGAAVAADTMPADSSLPIDVDDAFTGNSSLATGTVGGATSA